MKLDGWVNLTILAIEDLWGQQWAAIQYRSNVQPISGLSRAPYQAHKPQFKFVLSLDRESMQRESCCIGSRLTQNPKH